MAAIAATRRRGGVPTNALPHRSRSLFVVACVFLLASFMTARPCGAAFWAGSLQTTNCFQTLAHFAFDRQTLSPLYNFRYTIDFPIE